MLTSVKVIVKSACGNFAVVFSSTTRSVVCWEEAEVVKVHPQSFIIFPAQIAPKYPLRMQIDIVINIIQQNCLGLLIH